MKSVPSEEMIGWPCRLWSAGGLVAILVRKFKNNNTDVGKDNCCNDPCQMKVRCSELRE